jgi:hypothetical protein
VALLGWANYEIAIELSFPPKDGKSALDSEIMKLIAETTNLATRSLPLGDVAAMRSNSIIISALNHASFVMAAIGQQKSVGMDGRSRQFESGLESPIRKFATLHQGSGR